jgi:hypothetical protein
MSEEYGLQQAFDSWIKITQRKVAIYGGLSLPGLLIIFASVVLALAHPGFLFLGFVGLMFLLYPGIQFYIWWPLYNRAVGMKEAVANLPGVEARLVIDAYNDARQFFANGSNEEIDRAKFEKLWALYQANLKLSVEELAHRRNAAGITNPLNPWYEKGRTFEEAMLTAALMTKLKTAEAIIAATASHLRAAEQGAKSASNLYDRKKIEQTKASVEDELRSYTGNRRREVEPINLFEGECMIDMVDDVIQQLTFTLCPGDYSIKLLGRDSTLQLKERLVISKPDERATINVSRAGLRFADIELVVTERGGNAEERIPLW